MVQFCFMLRGLKTIRDSTFGFKRMATHSVISNSNLRSNVNGPLKNVACLRNTKDLIPEHG